MIKKGDLVFYDGKDTYSGSNIGSGIFTCLQNEHYDLIKIEGVRGFPYYRLINKKFIQKASNLHTLLWGAK